MEDTTFAPATEGIKTILTGKVALVSVERPTSAEAQALERDFGLTRADLDLALARAAPNTGVLRRSDYSLLRVPVPVVAPRSETLIATPIGVVVGRDFLLLVHTGEARPLLRFLRQLETDEALRQEAELGGVDRLLFRCFERVLDAMAAAQARLERHMMESEETLARGDGHSDPDFSRLLRRRGDIRLISRLVVPLATTVREAAELGLPSAEWDQAVARAVCLAEAASDNREEQDSLLLAYAIVTHAQAARLNRGLLVVAALTLPVLAVATLIELVYGNPLALSEAGSAGALGVVGFVLVLALYLLRRQNIL